MALRSSARSPARAPGPEPPIVVDGIGGLLAGPANVIMQLAMAPVGYGVIESRVDSGQVTRHPLKRFRTTFTYISVALFGTEAERARYREAVDGPHRLVRSGAHSPVRYNAFDPHLQLWVAACLYYGTVDVVEKLHGPLPGAQADALYEFAARFGTTLQMPADLWPADRTAFGHYWDETVARLSIDEPVRDYLLALVRLDHLPRLLRGGARLSIWVTTGFLPPEFRAEMRLPWSDADQRRFERLLRQVGAVQRRLPPVVRRFPFNWFLWDLRLRMSFDLRLV
jgi:uncharacterized protein (DUF2236 family)